MNNVLKNLKVALLVLLLSGCANLDKSLYNLTSSVSDYDRITGQRTANLTSRTEQIKKSNDIASKIIAETYTKKGKPVDASLDAKAYKRLQNIFHKVFAVSHMRNENWTIHLIPEDSFNAYVTGGTYMVVHKGLVDKVKSDDELAAVIGHEIAHVAANHIYEKNAHAIASILSSSNSIKRGSFQSAFIHENEEEADKVGILYAALAGYDPYAASKLWKRMYDNQGDFSLRIVDHPIYSERYQTTKELADKYRKYQIPARQNKNFATILKNNDVFSYKQNNTLQAGKGGGLLAALETVAYGLNKHTQAKTEEYRQKSRVLKIKRIQSLLQITEQNVINSNTVHFKIRYGGYETINNLTFLVVYNDEQVKEQVKEPVRPGNFIEFNTSFNSNFNSNFNSSNPKISLIVSHVD
jgi:predicted Zn-dependent protease